MRDHAEAVGAEEDRAAAFAAVGGVDAGRHRRRGLAALPRLAEAAGNQHHRFDRVGGDDLVDETVDRVGGDRDDQQVELVRERREALDAPDAVDLGLAGANDGQALLRVAAAHQVAQDDAAEIHAGGRDADDADRRRMEQLVDLVDGAGQAAGAGAPNAQRAARTVRRSPTCTGSSSSACSTNGDSGLPGEPAPASASKRAKSEREQRVRQRPPVALGDAARASGTRTCAGTGAGNRRHRSARRRRRPSPDPAGSRLRPFAHRRRPGRR